jgi:hypothetical protein
VQHEGPPRPRGPAVGPQHHVGVEDGDQPLEVAVAGRGEERVDHLALPGHVGLGRRRRTADPAPAAAGQLAGGGRGAVDHRADLVERHREHVVQHERQPLGRRQRVEHHEQGEADRVGEQCLLLRVGVALAADDRVRHVHLEWLLAPRLAGAQNVQAHPGDHGRQPAGEVLHLGGVGPVEPQPRLLDRVIGLAERPEHPVRHRAQPRPVLLEPLGQQSALIHPVTFLRRTGSPR